MPSRMVINGREVTSPLGQAVIGGLAAVVALAVIGLVLLLVLPLVGVTLGLSLGATGLVFIALALILPLLIVGRVVLAVLLAPFRALAALFTRKPPEPRDGVIVPDEWRRK